MIPLQLVILAPDQIDYHYTEHFGGEGYGLKPAEKIM